MAPDPINSARCFPSHKEKTLLSLLTSSLVTLMLIVGCGSDPPLMAPVDAAVDIDDTVQDASVETTKQAEETEPQPACTPKTCTQLEANCGSTPDGCGGVIECGTCLDGETCGGGGTNRCGMQECIPKTCLQLEAQCGWISDGCSQALDCGGCIYPQTCGGGGVSNECGCTPKTCSQLGVNCGTLSDGCDGLVTCGDCALGQRCGGGGPNICGVSECATKTCSQVGAACGLVSDGCSDVLQCGDCEAPNVCGGGGIANECGCPAKTCSQIGAACGTVETPCGPIECGQCQGEDTCGGAGIPNQCGCTCTRPNAVTQCLEGQCFVIECSSGFEDCDGDEQNGCEADLDSSLSHCGSCGRACSGNCSEGMCEVTSAETARKWDGSYVGSGALRTDNTQYNYQGQYDTFHGIQKSAMGAPDMMFSDLADAEVLDIWVHLHAAHWYWNSGGVARIGVHDKATKPSTFPGINQTYEVNFGKPERKWVRLPNAWYASFKSGAYRGITLHAGNSTDLLYYGYVTANETKWRWRYRK